MVLERSQELVFPGKARERRGKTLRQRSLLKKQTKASAAETWVRTRGTNREQGSEGFPEGYLCLWGKRGQQNFLVPADSIGREDCGPEKSVPPLDMVTVEMCEDSSGGFMLVKEMSFSLRQATNSGSQLRNGWVSKRKKGKTFTILSCVFFNV